ncbi:MAG: TolC family protein [Treponema sp.]|nr:TolC family protein [Treponema sp.]
MKPFFCVLLLCIIPVFVQAQTAPAGTAPGSSPMRLSLDEAVNMAINNNLMLESARIGTDIRRRRAIMSWNQFVPTVGVSGTLARDNVATAIPPWNLTGGLNTSLDFSFALFEGMRSAHLDYRAGLISLDKAKLQMEQGVRKMYNTILLILENANLHAESFNNAQQQAAIAEANFRAGLVPRLTWLQAQVAVENMRPAASELDNTIRNLKGNFAILLGLPYNTDFELVSVNPETISIPPDLSGFISRSAAMGKPDIIELQANIRALQSQRTALNLQQLTPFVRLGWNLSYLFNPMLDPFLDDVFLYDNWNRGGNFSVTLGMNFNSFLPFTREGQQRRDLAANLQIQNIMLAQMIQETELEIFSKINSLETIRSSVAAQQAAVELAQTAYNLTETAYRAGLQDFQSVQNSALALDQARLQLLTLYFNFMNDLIDLEYALGIPFGTLRGNQ